MLIDSFVPWDKQFIFSLTNGRCCSFKETTYIEGKYHFFKGCQKYYVMKFSVFLLLWVPHYSPTVTISLYRSLQTVKTVSIRRLWQLYILDPTCPHMSSHMSPAHPSAPTTAHSRTPFLHMACDPVSSIFRSLWLCAYVHPTDWNPCSLSSTPQLLLER